MRPERADIAAPELPPRVRWLNAEESPAMAELTATGPVLVHFFDFAQLNSVRALPYVNGWHDRYAPYGLAVLGAHSPRYPFGADRGVLAEGIARVGVHHPVADDSQYALWHEYGCRGWPSLFLWGPGGALHWIHFGEGEYQATEEEIAALLPNGGPAEPLAPLRPSDAPGARVMPPTPEVFPGGSPSEPWSTASGEECLTLEYEAGGAAASVDGSGELWVSIDGARLPSISIDAPGVYELGSHPRHGPHRLELRSSAGLSIYSIGFAAGVP
jgi:hypothetical protein